MMSFKKSNKPKPSPVIAPPPIKRFSRLKHSNSDFYNYQAAREEIFGQQWSIHRWVPKRPSPHRILCLHGFTGSGLDFKPLIEAFPHSIEWICPDLPGHGNTDPPPSEPNQEAYYAQIHRSLLEIAGTSASAPYLLAYSMGGRIALHSLSQQPQLFRQTFLISTSPGIQGENARKQRRSTDELLIDELKKGDKDAFFRKWNSLSLFDNPSATTGSEVKITPSQQAANLNHLARALHTFGPGWFPSCHGQLSNLEPVVWMVGEHDKKYCAIAQEIIRDHPHHTMLVIPDCGHRILADNAASFASILARSIRFV